MVLYWCEGVAAELMWRIFQSEAAQLWSCCGDTVIGPDCFSLENVFFFFQEKKKKQKEQENTGGKSS